MERHGKLYANGPRDVFKALVEHAAATQQTMDSSVTMSDIVYHYVLSQGEPPINAPNVWSAVKRPAARPVVSPIKGIRSSFCFRVAGSNTLAVVDVSIALPFAGLVAPTLLLGPGKGF